MGIFEKISRNVTGALNDLLDGSADTGREARQLVRELGEKIETTEKSYIDVKANLKLLENNRDFNQKESNKWKENAQKALGKNDENLARQCLEKKQEFDTRAKSFQNQIDSMKPQIELLEHQLDSLRKKHDEMSNTTDLLEARSETAKAQQKATNIISGINTKDITSDFDRLTKNVSKEEARAQVMMENEDKKSGKDLIESLEALDKKDSVEDELAKMKAESNKSNAA